MEEYYEEDDDELTICQVLENVHFLREKMICRESLDDFETIDGITEDDRQWEKDTFLDRIREEGL